MGRQLDKRRLSYLPLSEVITEPGDGWWDILVDRWWAHEPGKGLIFYGKSPQCNRIESLARAVHEKCHPTAELIFMPRVCLRHDCGDYL